MSDQALDALSEAISEERPVILVAGQAFGASDTHGEAILNGFLDRLGRKAQTGGWRVALTDPVTDADMAWLSERFDRHVPSESTLRVFDLPWSAVFTSSIDPRFAGRFETRGRQPEAVLSRGAYARVSRSRSRPPVYYLFGRANETVSDARPPKTKADLLRRSQNHASELLNRLAETATARGLVVIAGFDPARDWLDVDALLATLSDQAGVRAIWFGAPQRLDSVVADEMIAQGSLITTQTTVAAALASLDLQGRINMVGAAAPDEPGIVTTSAGILDITPQLRLRVEASARIVDDAWTEHPEPLEVSEFHESAVRERARSAPRASGRSALADQLIAAGIAEESTQLFDNDEALAATGEDAAARLIDLVMVAGRLSCPVPLNLLMRVISDRSDGLGVEGVAHLFQDLDLFRWRAADAEGTELLISPRLQLEAELICQRRLADPSREIDCLIELIKGVRPSGVDRNIERTFVLDLLQKLDRDGPRGQAYRRGYLRFADALEDLRKKAGVRDASLMLRECVFRRQAIFSLDGYNSTEEMDEDARLMVLDAARAVVEEALSRELLRNRTDPYSPEKSTLDLHRSAKNK